MNYSHFIFKVLNSCIFSSSTRASAFAWLLSADSSTLTSIDTDLTKMAGMKFLSNRWGGMEEQLKRTTLKKEELEKKM